MRIRIICAGALLAGSMLTTTDANSAAGTNIRAHFSFDALATCSRPPVQDFPLHGEGTGTLSVDRTATLDLNYNVGGRETYTAKLGGRPTEAPGGSASISVVSKHTLRAVRDFPNNSIIITMTVTGNACTMRIDSRLKPGKREYTFYGNLGVFYCSRPRITHTECKPN